MNFLAIKDYWQKIRIAIVLILLSFHSYAIPITPNPKLSANHQTVTNTYTFKQLGWDNSVILNGYQPTHTLYIPLSNDLNIQKVTLHLTIAFSTFLTKNAYLDIKFNETFIRSVSPPTDMNQKLTLDIDIPLTQLSSNWQTLKFITHLSGVRQLCDPDLWIDISPDSQLTITTTPPVFNATVNKLSKLFINPVSLNPVTLLLLLPQSPTREEIVNSFQIARHLGTLTKVDDRIGVTSSFIGDSEEEQKKHPIVLIGIYEQLFSNAFLTSLLSEPTVKKGIIEENGLILLNPSVFNPIYGLLTFTGTNYTALDKAVNAFLIPEFSKLASGNVTIVKSIEQTKAPANTKSWYETTFKKLDYTDQTVSGLGRHKLTYTFYLPLNRIPAKTTVTTLITAPSEILKEKSQITLIMNDSKQSLFKLTDDHSSWTADVDSTAMKPGLNTITYLIDLHLEKDQCTLNNSEQVWTTIYADTKISTYFIKGFPQAILNAFPIPFDDDIAIVMPDKLSKNDIKNLTQLSFKLGRLLPHNAASLKYFNQSEVNENYIRYHNLILYGTAANNPWIKYAFAFMPIHLENRTRFFKEPHVQIEFDEQNSAGLLEFVNSPWSENKAVLLITGNDEKGMTNAVNKFIDDTVRAGLKGNVALINQDQSIEVISTNDYHFINLTHQFMTFFTIWSKNTAFFLRNHTPLIIYIIVFGVPLFIYLRRKKK